MDQKTFNSMCSTHYEPVRRYLLHKHGDIGEDITQSAFLRAQEHIDKFDAGESAFRTWLITIGNNLAENYRRDEARRPVGCEVDVLSVVDYTTPEDIVSANQLAEVAEDVIEGMPPCRKETMAAATRSLDANGRPRIDTKTRRIILRALGENDG